MRLGRVPINITDIPIVAIVLAKGRDGGCVLVELANVPNDQRAKHLIQFRSLPTQQHKVQSIIIIPMRKAKGGRTYQ